MLKGKSDEVKGLPNSYLAQVTQEKNTNRGSRSATLDMDVDTGLPGSAPSSPAASRRASVSGAPGSPQQEPPPLPSRRASVSGAPGSPQQEPPRPATRPSVQMNQDDMPPPLETSPLQTPRAGTQASPLMNLNTSVADTPETENVGIVQNVRQALTNGLKSIFDLGVPKLKETAAPGNVPNEKVVQKPAFSLADQLSVVADKMKEKTAMSQDTVASTKKTSSKDTELSLKLASIRAANEYESAWSDGSVKSEGSKKATPDAGSFTMDALSKLELREFTSISEIEKVYDDYNKLDVPRIKRQNWYMIYMTKDYDNRLKTLNGLTKKVERKNVTMGSNDPVAQNMRIIEACTRVMSEYIKLNPDEPVLEFLKNGTERDFLESVKKDRESSEWQKDRGELEEMLEKIIEKYDYLENDIDLVAEIAAEVVLTFSKLRLWLTVKKEILGLVETLNASVMEAFSLYMKGKTDDLVAIYASTREFLTSHNRKITALISGQLPVTSDQSKEYPLIWNKMLKDYEVGLSEYYKTYVAGKEAEGEELEKGRFLLFRDFLIDLLLRGSLTDEHFLSLIVNSLKASKNKHGAAVVLTPGEKEDLQKIREIKDVQTLTGFDLRKKVLKSAEKVDAAMIGGEPSRFKIRKTGE
jgi:hypothetical protein